MTTKAKWSDPKVWWRQMLTLATEGAKDLHPTDKVEYWRDASRVLLQLAVDQEELNEKIGTPEHPDTLTQQRFEAMVAGPKMLGELEAEKLLEPQLPKEEVERLIDEIFGPPIQHTTEYDQVQKTPAEQRQLGVTYTVNTCSVADNIVVTFDPPMAGGGTLFYPDLTTCPSCRFTGARDSRFGDFCSERCRDGFRPRP